LTKRFAYSTHAQCVPRNCCLQVTSIDNCFEYSTHVQCVPRNCCLQVTSGYTCYECSTHRACWVDLGQLLLHFFQLCTVAACHGPADALGLQINHKGHVQHTLTQNALARRKIKHANVLLCNQHLPLLPLLSAVLHATAALLPGLLLDQSQPHLVVPHKVFADKASSKARGSPHHHLHGR
jgi:hypothetical protein